MNFKALLRAGFQYVVWLCLTAVLIGWIFSSRCTAWVVFIPPQSDSEALFELGIDSGRVYLMREEGIFGALHTRSGWDLLSDQPSWTYRDFQITKYPMEVLGFYVLSTAEPGYLFFIPIWFIAACLFIVLINLRRAFTFRDKSQPNMCRVCGYDLRASADRCPECGLQVDRKRKLAITD